MDIEIPSHPATVDLPDGSTLTVRLRPDEAMGAPWEEHDGHGIVSEWTTRDKKPGELVLAQDRSYRRFYDYAETVKIARKDGWGSEGKTPGERAARAALEDFLYLRGWCNDDWHWIGVVVEIERPDGSRDEASLWGIEDNTDYWREVAKELASELLSA